MYLNVVCGFVDDFQNDACANILAVGQALQLLFTVESMLQASPVWLDSRLSQKAHCLTLRDEKYTWLRYIHMLHM